MNLFVREFHSLPFNAIAVLVLGTRWNEEKAFHPFSPFLLVLTGRQTTWTCDYVVYDVPENSCLSVRHVTFETTDEIRCLFQL